jgi:peptidyl-prolyl cis-trans isomerase NIMA-interacting 1
MGVDIILDDPSVSQRHAAVVHHHDGRLFVIDLASRTGVFLDGEKIPANKPKLISHGTVIGIGPYVYRLHSTENNNAQTTFKPEKVCASHLLVKHAQSRRPSSWKQNVITRTPEEALEMIQHYRDMIVNNQCEFGTLTSTESDCSSAKRQGDLGWFGPGEMQKEFEQAAFALQVNELSDPVFSQSGIHLILRTA